MTPDPDSRRGSAFHLAVLHALPWLVGLVLMRVWVGYAPWLYGDTMQGMLGHGLTWASAAPSSYNHVPMPFSTQLAGLAYLMARPLGTTLAGFHDAALGLQAIIVVATSAWFGWAARRLAMTATAAAGIAAIGIGMPTLALAGVAFTGYFPALVPIPAAAAILAVALLRRQVSDIACRTALLIIGFGAANVYSLLPFAAAAFAAVLALGLPTAANTLLKDNRLVRLISLIAFFLAMHSLATGTITHSLPADYAGKIVRHGAYAVLPAALLTWAYIVLRRVYPLFATADSIALTPILSGWLLGTNIWAPLWFLNAVYSLASRGVGADLPVADSSFGIVSIIHLVAQVPWAILPILSVLHGVWLVARFIRARPDQAGRVAIGIVIVITILPVLALIAPALALAGDNPMRARYLVSLIPPAVMSAAYLLVSSSRINRIAGASFVACAVLTFAITILPWAELRRIKTAEAGQVDAAIDRFLVEHPAGAVICLRTIAPERCGLLYSFENYRSERSRLALPAPQIVEGRIRYALACSPGDHAGCGVILRNAAKGASSILVLSEGDLALQYPVDGFSGQQQDCQRYVALGIYLCRL